MRILFLWFRICLNIIKFLMRCFAVSGFACLLMVAKDVYIFKFTELIDLGLSIMTETLRNAIWMKSHLTLCYSKLPAIKFEKCILSLICDGSRGGKWCWMDPITIPNTSESGSDIIRSLASLIETCDVSRISVQNRQQIHLFGHPHPLEWLSIISQRIVIRIHTKRWLNSNWH